MALDGAGFELAIRDLVSLRPHEETIESHVEQMARQLEADKIQKDPILIDGKTGAVLDGMHRLAAFKALGYDRAVCCSLDYDSQSVEVGRWARVYVADGHRELEEVLREEGFTKRLGLDEALAALDDASEGVFVAVGSEARTQGKSCTLEDAFSLVRRMDEASVVHGWRREFVPEDERQRELSRGRMVMLVQKLRKEDVVRAAVSSRLFPCKTSMHMIDPRPVAVRFPLTGLKETDGSRAARMLSRSDGSVLPGGSTYEGRRYKERLLLLNPP